MNWRIKAALQGTMSMLPRSADLNRLFQRHVTRTLDSRLSQAGLTAKWDQTRGLVTTWRTACGVEGDYTALEIGTGWQPIGPIALRSTGATSVTTVEVQPLLRGPEVRRTLAALAAGIEEGWLACEAPDLATALRSALAAPDDATPSALLASCGVDVVVGDARSLDLPDGSIDLSVSNNTLEHIPPDDIRRILEEMARLASPGGASSHFIDLKDHYAGFDGGIGVYNFLTYPESRWRWYNNDLQFLNRLRASDYRRLATEAGMAIVAEAAESGSPDDLVGLELAPEFRHHDVDDVLVHSLWLTLSPSDPT